MITDALKPLMPSPDDIAAAMTKRGGWTKAQLAAWGVSWPPPKGWRGKLENEYRAKLADAENHPRQETSD